MIDTKYRDLSYVPTFLTETNSPETEMSLFQHARRDNLDVVRGVVDEAHGLAGAGLCLHALDDVD